jgi:nicotinamidase-related amidase
MAEQPGPAGQLLRREDAVLAVIDVQERLLPHVVGGDGLVSSIVKLLRFARIVGLPVIATEQLKLGATVGAIRDELPAVAPIGKTEFGCFGCEGFAEALAAFERSALILTGIEAHICIAQTALQALPTYAVHVVSDAVSSRTAHDRDIALERMRQAGAVVTSAEMLMYELLVRAGTDEFRKVLELVKGG